MSAVRTWPSEASPGSRVRFSFILKALISCPLKPQCCLLVAASPTGPVWFRATLKGRLSSDNDKRENTVYVQISPARPGIPF